MTSDALREAAREARAEAAPFVGVALVAMVLMAIVSYRFSWHLMHRVHWWVWLIAAIPYAILMAVFATGLGRPRAIDQRRRVAGALLAVMVVFTVIETGLLIATLVSPTTHGIGGPQLLMSAVVIWLSNVIAFGLSYWELDCGGPVRRALTEPRVTPDFQFPQDENPTLARPGWAPHLLDYMYVSLTNSIAFSPTDAMPLSRRAKMLMAIESAISIAAVLFVAARAVNILHS
jgi:hypothetical protein